MLSRCVPRYVPRPIISSFHHPVISLTTTPTSTFTSTSTSASTSTSTSACTSHPPSRVYSTTHPTPLKCSGKGVVGDTLSHTLHLAHASIGQVIDMPYESTMDSSYTQAWMSSFYGYDRLYTSTPFAQSLNFTEQVLPYTMVLFKAVSMGHVDENRAVLDLGFDNAVYVRPAYAGETFKQTFTIKHLRQTSDGENTIMTVGCELVNQKGQLVFSVDKVMLYPHVTPLSKISVAPPSRPAPPTSHLLAHILYNGDNLPSTSHLANLRVGQLVLHSVTRPIGNAANMALSTLFRWTHPTIYNMKRYSESERVVPGGLVLAATIGASSRGLFEMLHETIDHCSFLNKVSPVDLIGAVSYVTGIKSIQEGFEEVRITTLGIKNIDIAKELAGVSLPIELFTEPLRPTQLETFLKQECPLLADHIVVQVQRRMVRQSPYSQQLNIPLL